MFFYNYKNGFSSKRLTIESTAALDQDIKALDIERGRDSL